MLGVGTRAAARRGLVWSAFAVCGAAMLAGSASASELAGKTTLETRIVGDPAAPFSFLSTAGGEGYLSRLEVGVAKPSREARRRSLVYFGQLSDFQLTDEESPARVEFFDAQPAVNFSNSGHRPQEALIPFQVEASIRQMNNFGSSPVTQGDGTRAGIANVIATGDLADSQQRNEVEWVRTLLDGGTVTPGSGTADLAGSACELPPLNALVADIADPGAYTGVQDYDDYTDSQLFYDPEQPVGPFAAWPGYPNLLDRAQEPFQAEGLDAPSYVTAGNHDVLVQGNEDANAAFEDVATGCVKPMGPFSSADPSSDSIEDVLDPAYLGGLIGTDPSKLGLVPPDPERQYLDKSQQRQVYAGVGEPDAHGYGLVDPAESAASGDSALYYSFSPRPGIRMIALDTNGSGAGLLVDPVGQSATADGNIDDPQFRWLTRELDKAKAADELVITFSHHGTSSMNFTQPDELAAPCTGDDAHGHDANPGCDADPRSSSPIRTGEDFVELLSSYPNVIAHVAGHSHDNQMIPHPAGDGGWWEIKSPAAADWPAQSRLLDVMDNRDGTLSIFATLIDQDSPVLSPGDGTDTAAADVETLASLGRTISFNDDQVSHAAEGEAADRNVELLLYDPRTTAVGGGGGEPGLGCRGERRGTRGRDKLTGTQRDDLIIGLRGPDRIAGLAGNDCLRGSGGNDRIFGGIDNDLINAGAGRDRIKPGVGEDAVRAGRGPDRVNARDGARDRVKCGPGRDFVRADRLDVLKGCERAVRRA